MCLGRRLRGRSRCPLGCFNYPWVHLKLAVDDNPYGLALKDYLDKRYADPINHSRLY